MFDRWHQNPDEMEVLSDMTEGLKNCDEAFSS